MKISKKLFGSIIRGIVISRGDAGATIAEMRTDYKQLVCEDWPLYKKSTDEIENFLNDIEGLSSIQLGPNGPFVWFILVSPRISPDQATKRIVEPLAATESVQNTSVGPSMNTVVAVPNEVPVNVNVSANHASSKPRAPAVVIQNPVPSVFSSERLASNPAKPPRINTNSLPVITVEGSSSSSGFRTESDTGRSSASSGLNPLQLQLKPFKPRKEQLENAPRDASAAIQYSEPSMGLSTGLYANNIQPMYK